MISYLSQKKEEVEEEEEEGRRRDQLEEGYDFMTSSVDRIIIMISCCSRYSQSSVKGLA